MGNYQPEHVFALSQALALFDFYQDRIAECDAQIERALQMLCADKVEPSEPLAKPRHRTKQTNAPKFDARGLLYQLIGMDLTRIHGIGPSVALALIAECGTDMSRWPTEKHFASWLTLSPGCKISGGKVLFSRTRKSNSRVAARLRLVATTVGRTETALGAFYRRLAARIGKAKALTATARKIAVLFYRAMRFGIAARGPWCRAVRAALPRAGGQAVAASGRPLRVLAAAGRGRCFLGSRGVLCAGRAYLTLGERSTNAQFPPYCSRSKSARVVLDLYLRVLYREAIVNDGESGVAPASCSDSAAHTSKFDGALVQAIAPMLLTVRPTSNSCDSATRALPSGGNEPRSLPIAGQPSARC